MGSLERRLEKLEDVAGVGGTVEFSEWPVEDQLEDVLWTLQIHTWGKSVYQATDRELELLDALIDHEVLPEDARDRFERMNPDGQPKRERWLYEHREWAKRWREQMREAWRNDPRTLAAKAELEAEIERRRRGEA